MIKLAGDKVIITVAQTGAYPTKSMNPNLPEQPEEIAESAYACHQEGASICHIHARDKERKITGSQDVFQEIHDRIHSKCDIIVQDSTGGGPNLTLEQRFECLNAKPEMASLNMGTMIRVSGQHAGLPFLNIRKDIETYIAKMNELGIRPEMEVYNHAMFREVNNLIQKDLVKKPYYINLVLGAMHQGAVDATSEYLYSMIDFLPEDSIFNVTAIGIAQLPLTTMGMILGGCIRVGMEDNIYYRRGELVKNNAQLVARAVRIARELNKEPATPAEARKILGLKST